MQKVPETQNLGGMSMAKNVTVSRDFLDGVKILLETITGETAVDTDDIAILCRLLTEELEQKYEAIARREAYTERIRQKELK